MEVSIVMGVPLVLIHFSGISPSSHPAIWIPHGNLRIYFECRLDRICSGSGYPQSLQGNKTHDNAQLCINPKPQKITAISWWFASHDAVQNSQTNHSDRQAAKAMSPMIAVAPNWPISTVLRRWFRLGLPHFLGFVSEIKGENPWQKPGEKIK